ncbi:14605_t:CDS:1, partial [Cetraspora pellucida]
DEYNFIHPSPPSHGLDIDNRLENISSEIEDIIEYLEMIKDYIPSMLYDKFRKDIDNLTNNYKSLEDKIRDILYYTNHLMLKNKKVNGK